MLLPAVEWGNLIKRQRKRLARENRATGAESTVIYSDDGKGTRALHVLRRVVVLDGGDLSR